MSSLCLHTVHCLLISHMGHGYLYQYSYQVQCMFLGHDCLGLSNVYAVFCPMLLGRWSWWIVGIDQFYVWFLAWVSLCLWKIITSNKCDHHGCQANILLVDCSRTWSIKVCILQHIQCLPVIIIIWKWIEMIIYPFFSLSYISSFWWYTPYEHNIVLIIDISS